MTDDRGKRLENRNKVARLNSQSKDSTNGTENSDVSSVIRHLYSVFCPMAPETNNSQKQV
jgi:hypothetical protein